MDKKEQAEKIVQKMMAKDAFSQWLGIEIIRIETGYVKLQMEVRPDMMNGFNVSHGGVIFSLADTALAFASNSLGRIALALENNISFIRKVNADDLLTAETEELSIRNTMGVYNISVLDQRDEKVAFFRGTVYRTNEEHFKTSSE